MGEAEEPGRRGLVRVASWLALLLIAVLVALAPIPAYVLRPGPLFSLTESMTVDGAPADGLAGDFVFTTIAAEDAETLDLVLTAFDDGRRVVSRASLVPPGLDEEAFVAEQQASFAESQGLAAEAAGTVVGREVEVEVDTDVVGGPSAGLLIALATVDVVEDADLAAGRLVSGTGEVTADGQVEGVGSVALKVRAAQAGGVEVFLVPSAQAAEAQAALPADSTMVVIGVDTVAEAVVALGG